jgi:hypothetical protein
MRLRRPDGTGRGTLRHVTATVARVFPDSYNHDGAEHQHIWIDDLRPLDDGPGYAGDVFVAIRVTDGGIGREIPFRDDTEIELQGLLIPADEADSGPDDPGLPVLHFTHRPEGFVIYEGETYD